MYNFPQAWLVAQVSRGVAWRSVGRCDVASRSSLTCSDTPSTACSVKMEVLHRAIRAGRVFVCALHMCGRTKENHEKPQSGYLVLRAIYEPRTSRI
jgi:hypothetical protein